MDPILSLFLSLLISAGTTKKLISSSKDYRNLPLLVNDLEEEDNEEGVNNGDNYVAQSPEDHDNILETDISTSSPVSKDMLMLKNSMQNLREYLKLLSKKKAEEEQLESFEAEPSEESKFGPHYLNIITQGPVEESPRGDLRAIPINIYNDPVLKDLSEAEQYSQSPQSSETDYHPRNMFFKPVPMSDQGDLIQKKAPNVARKKDVRETLMLAVSSITLIILVIFMICCVVTLNQYSKRKKDCGSISNTQAKQQRLACLSYFQPLEGVSDSSFSRTADNSIWNVKTLSEIQSNQSGHSKPRTLSNIKSVDDVSSISDESTRSGAPSCKAANTGENEF